jgi:hypothetical protein
MKSVIYKTDYVVYEDGRVWSNKKNAWLKISTNNGGYKQLTIAKEHWDIHKLLATLFIPNPDNLPLVMHLDNDKTNNSIDNLKWGTYSDNNKHAYRSGKKVVGMFAKDYYGETHHSSKLTKEDVIEIRNSTLSSRKLADIYGVSKTNILNVKANKIWKSDYL